jgi:hypothetical protein
MVCHRDVVHFPGWNHYFCPKSYFLHRVFARSTNDGSLLGPLPATTRLKPGIKLYFLAWLFITFSTVSSQIGSRPVFS